MELEWLDKAALGFAPGSTEREHTIALQGIHEEERNHTTHLDDEQDTVDYGELG